MPHEVCGAFLDKPFAIDLDVGVIIASQHVRLVVTAIFILADHRHGAITYACCLIAINVQRLLTVAVIDYLVEVEEVLERRAYLLTSLSLEHAARQVVDAG